MLFVGAHLAGHNLSDLLTEEVLHVRLAPDMIVQSLMLLKFTKYLLFFAGEVLVLVVEGGLIVLNLLPQFLLFHQLLVRFHLLV